MTIRPPAVRARRVPGAALALAASLVPAPALALDPGKAVTQYVMNVWTMQRGLPHGTVSAILQGRDGYLWVGTYQGLARFDGVSFRVFNSGNSGLRDNGIRSLCEEADGALLIGTTSGGLFRHHEGEITRAGPAGTVLALIRTRGGEVWAGTSNGLIRPDGGRSLGTEAFRGRQVNAISEGSDGTLWLGTSGGLGRLSGGRGEALDWVGSEPVQSVLSDSRGRLWVGTAAGELRRFEAGRAIVVERRPRTPIAALHEDRDGLVWVGTYGDGLHRFGPDGRVAVYGQAQGFPDRRAWALAEDREGSLWVGTRGGLVQLRDGPVTTYSQAEGLPSDVARAVLAEPDGSTLIGTDGGAARITRAGAVEPVIGLPPGLVYSLMRDRAGALWAGGMGVIARRDSRGTSVYSASDGVPAERVKILLQDRLGQVWAGTGHGLAVLSRDHAGWASRFQVPKALARLAPLMIEALFEDRAGTLWIGTQADGLWRYRDGALSEAPLQGPVSSFGVRSLLELRDGSLLVGSIGAGLFLLERGGTQRVTTTEGLASDDVWTLVEDGADGLFLASDIGISRVSTRRILDVARGRAPRVEPSLTLGRADGMKTAECNGGGGPPFARGRDGRLWFPTREGVVAFHPARLQGNALPPPVVVEEVFVDHQPARRRAGVVIVPPGSRGVEIRYAAISFADPSKVRFRYQLLGQDEIAVEPGTRRTAYYNNLAPGRYTFRVRACNNDGVWGATDTEAALEVQPLLIQRLPVRIAIGLLAVAAVAAAVRRRLAQLARQKAELAVLVTERTQSLAEANEALRRLALVDGLTGLANRRRFDEVLAQEWARARRNGTPLSLVLADVDAFKAFNDRYGHPAGDACLAAVGRVLLASARRATDTAARYGGEEFAVILPATPLEGARELAETLRANVAALGIPHEASPAAARVTLSAGVAAFQPGLETKPEALVAEADRALYAAKQGGRNRVVVT